jgi:RimJ/RimL family protein N-acetyltransferase
MREPDHHLRVLNTARLTLRPHVRDDFDDVAALWADPVVTRFIGGRTSTREESWARLLRYVGHWELMGFGFWTVRETATGRFVGEVGLADFMREIDPPFGGAPEAGWVLAPAFHGRGYATEAVRAAIAWGGARFGAGFRVKCLIEEGNAPSVRVAQKVGFREFARTNYKGSKVVLYERAGV